jgi:hypothetical protein
MRPITSVIPAGQGSFPAYSSPSPINGMIRLDEWAFPPIAVQIAVTGTVNFTVQHSFDEGPDSLVNPISLANMFWDTGLIPPGGVNGAAGVSFSLPVAPLWLRIVLNSGSGSVRMVVTQYNAAVA